MSNVKISELPALLSGINTSSDVLPIVNSGITKKITVAALVNSMIMGTVTSVAGKTGNVVLESADISDATSSNTASRLVLRDASGNFSAGTITASLSGSATTAGTVTTAAQPAITSVGTLTGLTVTGSTSLQGLSATTGAFSGGGGYVVSIGADATGGKALELLSIAGGSAITSYDRTSSAYLNLTFNALAHYFKVGGITQATLDGSTFAITGALSVGGNITAGTKGTFGTYASIGTSTTARFYSDATNTAIRASGGGVYIQSDEIGTATWAVFKSSGTLNLPLLPTSSAGLSAGDLWNDAGTIKIV